MIKVPKDYRQEVGKILKNKRIEKNMSLKDLGQKVQMDPGNLSRIENGLISVTYDKLSQISIILEAPAVFLITGLPMPDYFLDKLYSSDNGLQEAVNKAISTYYTKDQIDNLSEEDPVNYYASLKPFPDTLNNFNYEVVKNIIKEDGSLLNLNNFLFIVNPWLRDLIINEIEIAAVTNRISSLHEQILYLELSKLDDAKSLVRKIVENNGSNKTSNFLSGYITGIMHSYLTLVIALKEHGLYWFLAGFVFEPADALLLETFYDSFKDKSPDEKEKLIDAFKGFLELYEAMNNKKR